MYGWRVVVAQLGVGVVAIVPAWIHVDDCGIEPHDLVQELIRDESCDAAVVVFMPMVVAGIAPIGAVVLWAVHALGLAFVLVLVAVRQGHTASLLWRRRLDKGPDVPFLRPRGCSRDLPEARRGPVVADSSLASRRRARHICFAVGPRAAASLSPKAGRSRLVTGLDLDPAMIARARLNAESHAPTVGPKPVFAVGDVAALPFGDGSFDSVASSLSMHHWSKPAAGLAEIARVLRPGGSALIWDLRPGFRLFHAVVPDPSDLLGTAPLRIVSVVPWRWPSRISFSRRLELARDR